MQYAVDLGFAFAVWKVYGLAFDKIALNLEPSFGKKRWTFENAHIAFLRVASNNGIRCLKLLNNFSETIFRRLLPSTWTTK